MTALYLVSLGMVWQMRLFSTKKMFLTAGRKSGFRESELLSTFWLHRQLCDPTIFFPLFVLCRGRRQLFPSGSLRVWRGVSIWLINRDFLLSSLISTTIWKPILRGLKKVGLLIFIFARIPRGLCCSLMFQPHPHKFFMISFNEQVRSWLQSFWKQLVRLFPNVEYIELF